MSDDYLSLDESVEYLRDSKISKERLLRKALNKSLSVGMEFVRPVKGQMLEGVNPTDLEQASSVHGLKVDYIPTIEALKRKKVVCFPVEGEGELHGVFRLVVAGAGKAILSELLIADDSDAGFRTWWTNGHLYIEAIQNDGTARAAMVMGNVADIYDGELPDSWGRSYDDPRNTYRLSDLPHGARLVFRRGDLDALVGGGNQEQRHNPSTEWGQELNMFEAANPELVKASYTAKNVTDWLQTLTDDGLMQYTKKGSVIVRRHDRKELKMGTLRVALSRFRG